MSTPKETSTRSFIKGLTWRAIAILNGGLIAYIFLGSWSKATIISLSANFTGFILYFLHERFWSKINWKYN
jgi:uncharacterized membrane protein